MEQDKLPCTGAGPDQEQFERIWRRVMPEPRPDCPFTLYSEEPHRLMPADDGPVGPQDVCWKPPAMELSLAPMVPMRANPVENDVLCLGAASAVHGELLQDFIADELTDSATYRNMSRRVSGQTAGVLGRIAEDERRHAKRLSAAYFLISGVRFWPDKLPAVPMSTFMGGVRQRFIAEQKGELAYRTAAAHTGDPYLRELFLALAGEEASHAWLLRDMLERM